MRFTESLKQNRDFKRLYNRGRRKVSKNFALYYRHSGNAAVSRLGITVGTKLGGAVKRNKIRRRIREIYRLEESRMAPGFDLVIVARVGAARCTYDEMQQELSELFKTARLKNSDNDRS